jgi:protein-S-isoprenylcysteine O-methyltransferase Ste14
LASRGTRLTRTGLRGIVREFVHVLVHLGVLLLSAGSLAWVNAWVCAGLGLGFQVVNTAVLLRFNPELLDKRGRLIQPETKSFDKLFIGLYVPLGLATSVVAGLDAVRFGWSHVPPSIIAAGVALYLLSCAFGSWAMAVNRHFESTVFVARDGSQQVCSAGPYRIVRHPGYTAAVVGSVGYVWILGSWWALVPTGLMVLLFVVRTSLEDATLKEELPGYREYAARTTRRLIPLVW